MRSPQRRATPARAGRAVLVPVSAVSAACALVLAGCGQQSGPASAGRSASASVSGSVSGSASASPSTDPATGQPWLVRFDSYGGADGETITTRYVRVVPATGRTQVATMPEVTAPEARSQALLVDAAHRWAVPDTQPDAADRAAGRVVVRDLTAGGRARTIDVRAASGTAGLRTDYVSFDPREAGLLRVVSGSQVWTVAVPSGTTTRAGSLPERTDWVFAGGFTDATGKPYIEDPLTFDTLPTGNGQDVEHAVERDGGTVLDPGAEKPYGDRPAPGCESSAGFAGADGTDWAFCQVGATIVVKRLPRDASTWTTLGTTRAVVSPDASPVLVLPPTG